MEYCQCPEHEPVRKKKEKRALVPYKEILQCDKLIIIYIQKAGRGENLKLLSHFYSFTFPN